VKGDPTRCNKSDVYSQIFISTCFGHHYAHLQENQTVDNNKVHTVHMAHGSATHDIGQHNQCRTPYAVVHSLVLLKMGIMMLETC
jgi:hypothetical protein